MWFVLLAVLVCGCFGEKYSPLLTSYDKADAKSIAVNFIQRTEYYGFKGKAASCEEARQLDCDGCWQLKCTFMESDGSIFGGTTHKFDITVKSGAVTSAVFDGNKTVL